MSALGERSHELMEKVLNDPKVLSSLSRYKGFRPETRALLGRPAEISYSPAALGAALFGVAFLFYALYVQYIGSRNHGWLFLAFLLKESGALTLVFGTLAFIVWRSARFALQKAWQHYTKDGPKPEYETVYADTLDLVDTMGDQYTQVLLFMGKNSSNVLRIGTVFQMIYEKNLNVSRKDFDALLLNVSNMCFSLFIMSSVENSNERSLLLSVAFSLMSLLFFLCQEKSILMGHYWALRDINESKLNKFEILLYIAKLQEDFLEVDVTHNYIDTLLSNDPPQLREMGENDLERSVAEKVQNMTALDYATASAKSMEHGVDKFIRTFSNPPKQGKQQ